MDIKNIKLKRLLPRSNVQIWKASPQIILNACLFLIHNALGPVLVLWNLYAVLILLVWSIEEDWRTYGEIHVHYKWSLTKKKSNTITKSHIATKSSASYCHTESPVWLVSLSTELCVNIIALLFSCCLSTLINCILPSNYLFTQQRDIVYLMWIHLHWEHR